MYIRINFRLFFGVALTGLKPATHVVYSPVSFAAGIASVPAPLSPPHTHTIFRSGGAHLTLVLTLVTLAVADKRRRDYRRRQVMPTPRP